MSPLVVGIPRYLISRLEIHAQDVQAFEMLSADKVCLWLACDNLVYANISNACTPCNQKLPLELSRGSVESSQVCQPTSVRVIHRSVCGLFPFAFLLFCFPDPMLPLIKPCSLSSFFLVLGPLVTPPTPCTRALQPSSPLWG